MCARGAQHLHYGAVLDADRGPLPPAGGGDVAQARGEEGREEGADLAAYGALDPRRLGHHLAQPRGAAGVLEGHLLGRGGGRGQ